MAAARKHKRIKLLFLLIFILGILGLFYIISLPKEEDLLKPEIAVIKITGDLKFNGQIKEVTDLIKEAEKDPKIKAVIFEINSPGGTVVASSDLAAAIKSMKKPTVALLREVAASGAYWVASSCDKIVADPATITGSIGVTGSYLQFSKLMEKHGVAYERLVSGPYKDTGSPYKELTPEEREMLMRKINMINELFIYSIAQNRGLDVDYVRKLATGEIFLGLEAKELGLVDELGGRKKAQKLAEQLAGIKSSRVVLLEKRENLIEWLTQKAQVFAYWIGRGIGDSWNIFTDAGYAIEAKLG